MYLNHFGLREMPFNVTPDPRFLFFSRRHREAFDHLIYGIEHRKGFIELIGEVGLGKTTLCRAVLNSLSANVQTALVLNPSLTENQLLRAILHDLGISRTARDRLGLIEQLNAYLLAQSRDGKNVAVFIDEAQNLFPDVLEQIRLLNNLETDQHKLMQIVLSGQPELQRRLRRPELRQLRQRVLVRCGLEPLNLAEVGQYIEHRLRVAGAAEPACFHEAAVRMVFQRSGGIPRLINALCDRALMAGYVAGLRQIGRSEVARAAQDLEGDE